MTTTLKVSGMSCQHCVKHVTEALQGMAGVRSAQVDLAKGTAIVEHDTGVTVDAMIDAIEDEGYEAEA